MVNISRDKDGKTRVAKGDKTGLGGQYAPDPAKIVAAKTRLEELETLTDTATPDWKKYYPTPTFREFDSVDITLNGEYVISDDLNPTYDGGETETVNSFLISELDVVLMEHEPGDIIEMSIAHVPEHVEPSWNHKTVILPQRLLTKNRKFDTEEQKTLNNMVDTVFPINIVSQNTNELHIRETDGVTQIRWTTSEPLLDEEANSENIINKLTEYNKKFQNVKATTTPSAHLVTFTGWHTLTDDEKNILKKITQ